MSLTPSFTARASLQYDARCLFHMCIIPTHPSLALLCGADGGAYIGNLKKSGAVVHRFIGHGENPVRHGAVSLSGKLFYTISCRGVLMHEMTSGELENIDTIITECRSSPPVREFLSDVRYMSLSQDGRLLAVATASEHGIVLMLDPLTLTLLSSTQLKSDVEDVSVGALTLTFGPSSCILAVAGSDHAVYLFDTRDEMPTFLRTLHRVGLIPCIAFSPDERSLCASGPRLTLWDVQTGEKNAEYDESHSVHQHQAKTFISVQFISSHAVVFSYLYLFPSGVMNNMFGVWNTALNQEVCNRVELLRKTTGVTVSEDSSKLFAYRGHASIQVFDILA